AGGSLAQLRRSAHLCGPWRRVRYLLVATIVAVLVGAGDGHRRRLVGGATAKFCHRRQGVADLPGSGRDAEDRPSLPMPPRYAAGRVRATRRRPATLCRRGREGRKTPLASIVAMREGGAVGQRRKPVAVEAAPSGHAGQG